MLSLRCPAQNYAWGRPAEKSEVTWRMKVWVGFQRRAWSVFERLDHSRRLPSLLV
jgi:hypothetical protein